MSEPEDTGRTVGRGLRGLVRLVVGLALLGVLLYYVPWSRIVGHIGSASLGPLLMILILVFAGILVSSLKLQILLRTKAPGITLGTVVQAYYFGTFFNNFLPTSVGGDVVKVARLRDAGVPLGHATAATIVERGSGVAVALALAAAVALGWGGFFERLDLTALRGPLAALGIGPFFLVVVLYPLWRSRIKPFLKTRRDTRVLGTAYRIISGFYVFRNNPAVLLQAVGLSCLFYLLMGASLMLVSGSVGGAVGPGEAMGIVPLRTLPGMLPVSVGGLGVREGVITYCLAGVGLGAGRAAAAALLLRFLGWMHSACGGLLYLLDQPRRSDAK